MLLKKRILRPISREGRSKLENIIPKLKSLLKFGMELAKSIEGNYVFIYNKNHVKTVYIYMVELIYMVKTQFEQDKNDHKFKDKDKMLIFIEQFLNK